MSNNNFVVIDLNNVEDRQNTSVSNHSRRKPRPVSVPYGYNRPLISETKLDQVPVLAISS